MSTYRVSCPESAAAATNIVSVFCSAFLGSKHSSGKVAGLISCFWNYVVVKYASISEKNIVICGLLASTIFFDIISQRTRFLKKKRFLNVSLLICSATLVWNISHYKNNLARYYHKCDDIYMSSTPFSCQILMKLEFSREIFEKARVSNLI